MLFVMLFQWPADLGQRMKRKVSVASTPIVTATSVVTPGLNGTQKSPLRWLDAHRGTASSTPSSTSARTAATATMAFREGRPSACNSSLDVNETIQP